MSTSVLPIDISTYVHPLMSTSVLPIDIFTGLISISVSIDILVMVRSSEFGG